MTRLAWTDERLDERMAAIDQTFERMDDRYSDLQGRLLQIGFGLVAVLIAALTTVVLALA